MTTFRNDGVRDPGEICLALRDDLLISFQSYQDGTFYIIEDRTRGRFFRLGLAEGAFLSQLDGRTTLRQALQRTAVSLGDEALSEQDALSIIHWLLETDLAHPPGPMSAISRI